MTRPVPVVVVALVIAVVLATLTTPMVLIGAGEAGFTGTQEAQSAERTASTANTNTNTNAYAVNDVDSQEFDSTTFEITVHENGSATWTFRHELQLEDEDDEANFEAFADEFESEETGLYERFTEQAEALTEAGDEMTDRDMAATDFRRSASTEDGHGPMSAGTVGVVEMSFVWEGFAAVEDDRIVVGDVFQNIYLGSDQSIRIEPGGDLVFTSAAPEGKEYAGDSIQEANSVTWNGEREFIDGHPRVVLQDADDVAADGNGTENTISPIDGANTLSWSLLVGLIVVAVGAAIWYRRTRNTVSADAAAAADSGAESESKSGSGSGPGPESGGTTDTDTDARDDSLSETELLSDEDRVIELIRENGGRMKQVNIVEETGWSKSKVSMLLSDMESEGTISKLRVGRENIISLEGFEPEATKSPFDE